MRRIRLTVAYDGTNYCGWQVQPNGRSIQEELQKAVIDLVGEETGITGASRTDSGVHALGQIAVFDTNKNIPADRFAQALNSKLPEDIVVQKSEEVAPDFHPRYTTVRKTYRYRIVNRRTRLPAERLYSYFVPKKLDLAKMREAAAYLVGAHDFRSFCSQKTEVLSTVREIYDLRIIADEDKVNSGNYLRNSDSLTDNASITNTGENVSSDILTIEVTGNGFLYNMVRIIAGTLVSVGLGQMDPDAVKEAIEHPQPKALGPTAPAKGLTLVSIEYPDEK